MRARKLQRQLRNQGSTPLEARQLLHVADGLRQLPVPHLSNASKQAIAEQLGIQPCRPQIYTRLAVAGSLAAVACILATAWFSGPGSHIYGVKGLTNFFHHQTATPTSQKISSPNFGPIQPLQTLPENPKTNPAPSNAGSTPVQTPNGSTNNGGASGDSLERRSDVNSKPGTGRQRTNQSSNWFNGYNFFFHG